MESLSDLQPGMLLEGVVTNVAAFGAFVDIGVHQDGLVHVSAMANRFVKNPQDLVKPASDCESQGARCRYQAPADLTHHANVKDAPEQPMPSLRRDE